MKKILDSSATVNSLVYSGGGVESAAALAYAVSKGYNPAVVTIQQSNTPPVQKMIEAAKQQAEYFSVPIHIAKHNEPIAEPGKFNISDAGGADVTVRLILGNPQWDIKWLFTGTNAEDSLQQRVQTRYMLRLLAARWGGQYELAGMKWKVFKNLPQWVFPFECLTKAEIIGMLMMEYPELMNMTWTCHYPKRRVKMGDGGAGQLYPCGKCDKCIEYTGAFNTAKRALKRVQEGEEYVANLRK